jgi:hypothetical protein
MDLDLVPGELARQLEAYTNNRIKQKEVKEGERPGEGGGKAGVGIRH